MYQLSAVDRDILDFAEYWGARKARWIDAASSEFEEYVHPFAMRMRSPLPRYLAMTNIYFTEWALFERPLIDGRRCSSISSSPPAPFPRIRSIV